VVYAPPKWKLSVDDYYRMAEAGILHEDDRVELLDGELYEMTPIGDDHAGTTNYLNAALSRRLDVRYLVAIQNPIRLSDYSEPEPDITLLRPQNNYYRDRKPRPDDVLLLIEIADTSIDYDQTTKLPRYAAAGIVEVWIVNLGDDRVEVYRDPIGGQYRTQIVLIRGDSIFPQVLPDLVLHVDEILG
jgi:Uma2 family endonuclease